MGIIISEVLDLDSVEFTDEEIEIGANLLGVEKNVEELSKVEKS